VPRAAHALQPRIATAEVPPPHTPLQVRILTEEEYAECQRKANYTRGEPARHIFAPSTAHFHGSNITMRVVDSTHTPGPARYFVADHALDGANASVRDTLREQLADLPLAPGPASFPQPGDYLEPGPLGLDEDWVWPPSDEVTDLDVVHAQDGDAGPIEVRFSAGGRWGRGDGADVLLAEELRRRRMARKEARKVERRAKLVHSQDADDEVEDQDLLVAGETLEGLQERLVLERLMCANASGVARGGVGVGAARPGAALELTDSIISAFAKQMDLKHLGPVENPVDMRGLMVEPENGEGLAEFARIQWQREGDVDQAARWFRQALACAPTNGVVLGQYGLFLVDALGDYARAEPVFRRALYGLCRSLARLRARALSLRHTHTHTHRSRHVRVRADRVCRVCSRPPT
jgi:hypothetical protein